MKKIKLECWWSDTQSLSNRFIKQFVSDLEGYEFVNKNPDFTVVFGRTEWEKIETKKENTLYFSQEPLWSPNQPKDGIHEYCSKIFVSDKRDYPDRSEYIETLLPMFYAGHGESDHREEWDWSRKIENKTYLKNKIISCIVRKEHYSHYNHLVNPETSVINYENRTNLSNELSKNKKIDIFGANWESNGENIKGQIWNKHVGLDDYKFSFSFENTLQKNYVSEKFWDVILTDTVPIYLGCTNILNYIDGDSFIYLNGLSFDEIVEKSKDIIDNHDYYYDLYKEKIKFLKNEFFTNPNFNLWEKIKLEIK